MALLGAEHENAPVDTYKETVLTTNMGLTEPEHEFFESLQNKMFFFGKTGVRDEHIL